jgi:hypothetical protein
MRRFLAVLGILLAIAFVAFRSTPQPGRPERAATVPPLSNPSVGTRFADSDFTEFKAKYGQPSQEDSTAYDVPRPPMVTRWLVYNNQRLRLVFLADGKVGDPPPYTKWIYVGAVDEYTKEALKAEEVEQRFSRGEAPVLVPVPRPKAPATPFEQAALAIKNDDEETALKILRPLAERGESKAQFQVGELYYLFKEQNAEALKWFRLAANQGNPAAMYFLGNMSNNGHGVPQNYVEAYKWYSLAASRAEPRASGEMDTVAMATQNRDGVARKMTPSQVADAQRLAREWKPSPKQGRTPPAPLNISPK